MQHNQEDLSGCEWDKMTKWQRRWFFVFLLSLVLWGAPIYESMLGIKLAWVMPIAGITAIISAVLSGMLPTIIRSFNK